MKTTLLTCLLLSGCIAQSAAAHPGRQAPPPPTRPAVQADVDVLSKTRSGSDLANVGATVNGLANLNVDVLSSSKGKSSILDLSANVGQSNKGNSYGGYGNSRGGGLLDLDLSVGSSGGVGHW